MAYSTYIPKYPMIYNVGHSATTEINNNLFFSKAVPCYTRLEVKNSNKIPVEKILFPNPPKYETKFDDENENCVFLSNGTKVSHDQVFIQIQYDSESNFKFVMPLTNLLKRYNALDKAYKKLVTDNETLNCTLQKYIQSKMDQSKKLADGFTQCQLSNTATSTRVASRMSLPTTDFNPNSTNDNMIKSQNKLDQFESSEDLKQLAKTESKLCRDQINYTKIKPQVNSDDSIPNLDLATLLELKTQLLPNIFQSYSVYRRPKCLQKVILKKPSKNSSAPSYLKPTASSIEMAKRTKNKN